ncbi:hypothetical protein [Companilactobacillus mishanensis]|uniref:Surface layer protein A domain-containing protein n=1 Tax=Companilactobacillus mishanensis TaxID=2486008 RepID=A0ABW9P7Q4_9LACO|nr:hypothetical protein [Companilactobacillus mishanensis]MQS45236.1 hypothetical protein [Companilactobacillus mishanensis]
MKKTKYAGIAVAVLLALTPVTTTTTNAASLNVESIKTTQGVGASLPDLSQLTSLFDKVKDIAGQIGNFFGKIAGGKDTSTTPDSPKPMDMAIMAVNAIPNKIYSNNPLPDFSDIVNSYDSTLKYDELPENVKNTIDKEGQSTISSVDSLRYKVTTASPGGTKSDLQADINNMVKYGNGNSFSIDLIVTDSAQNDKFMINRQINYINNSKDVVPANNMIITYKDPVNVNVGDKTVDVKHTSSATNGTSVKDKNGNNVSYIAQPSGKFYANSDDAINGKNEIEVGPTFQLKGASVYQPVTLTFDKAIKVWDIYSNMNQNGSQIISVNGNKIYGNAVHPENNSITFVRQIKVNDPNEKPTTKPDTNTPNPDTNNPNPDPDYTIGVWKETDQPGYVITNSSVSRLTNDETSDSTRALAPNTNWATDKFRVNTKTGVKQYRVSTHEWVNASDVTFRNSTPGLTNFTSIAGGYATVKLAGPDGFVYDLFGKNGSRVQRGLAGNSNWATDMTATGKDGKTYYRVSTDEWVPDGAGVTVK